MRTEREVGEALERLHLDHERPLHETCHRWRAALPSCGAPRSWDDGLDGAALCHDLFGVCACASGVNGEACVRFRCGPPRDAEDGTRVLQFVDHAYCHRSQLGFGGCGWSRMCWFGQGRHESVSCLWGCN